MCVFTRGTDAHLAKAVPLIATKPFGAQLMREVLE